MIDTNHDYLRTMRSAAWMWVLYLVILAFVDMTIYAYSNGPLMPVLWYHLINTLPSLIFLGLSYSKWIKNGVRMIPPLMILLITAVPILLNYIFDLQLPPGPLSNLEGMVLRLLPVLMVGLVLVAWRYRLRTMVLYTLGTNFCELLLVLALNRSGDPRYSAFYFIILIRAACFMVVGIFINQSVKQMRMLAIRDSLTGLYNRHYLNEFLNQAIARAEREKTMIAFVLMDIDYFKRLNDTFGHLAGDTMLRAVGSLLEKNTRQGDIACRFGGEEFLLVMPGSLMGDALIRAVQICKTLEATRVIYGDMQLNTTFSAGIAGYPIHGKSIEAVLKVADDGLLEAKLAGRNCVICSQPIDNSNLIQSREITCSR